MQIRSRHTIRRNPPTDKAARIIEPWAFEKAAPNTALAKLERSFFTALESVDALEDRVTENKKSGKFTEIGMAEDALNFAASKLAPSLKRAKLAVDTVREELAAKQAQLVMRPADKTDVAGQTRRLWKVQQVAAMNSSQRNIFLADENLDPEIVMGILEVPQFSNALPSDLERLRERALRSWYGPEVFAEIEQLQNGIATADRALDAARETIAQDVGGLPKFNAAAEPHEKTAGGPLWLKKIHNQDGTETVKVFKQAGPNEGRWVDATEQEIAGGGYHKNFDQWVQAGHSWPAVVERKSA